MQAAIKSKKHLITNLLYSLLHSWKIPLAVIEVVTTINYDGCIIAAILARYKSLIVNCGL